MAKLTLNPIASGYTSTALLNQNFDDIEAAIENTLSRDGTSPNSMEADFDMNDHDLLNASRIDTRSLWINGVQVSPSEAIALDNNLQMIDSVVHLRTIPVTTSEERIYLKAHTDEGDGGHGFFRAATGAAVGTYVDNNGTTIVPIGGDGSSAWLRVVDNGTVTPQMFGAKADGVIDDSAPAQAAHDSGYTVHYPAGDYLFGSQVNVTTSGQRITGAGWSSAASVGVSRIFASIDIKLFYVTGSFVHFEGLFLDSTAASMSVPHVHFAGDAFSSMDRCRLAAVENFTATGGGIVLDDGAGGLGGSVGVLTNINISHGTIKVLRSDVHIKNSWIWANSRPYGIYASGSVGNLVIEGCDVLPPQTLVAARKAAIYLSGSLSNPRILGCNFDGNSSLSTGPGLLAENGVLGLLVSGCYGFGHNEDCIILDSIISPHVTSCTFKNNNISGNGSTDVTLRDTFPQNLERPLIHGNSFTQTAAISGTVGPAVKLVAGTNRSGVRIIDNTIHQPGTGGGYTNIEILLEDGAFTSEVQGSLRGNRGTRSQYSYSGSTSVLDTDTFKTVSYGSTMAYAPRPDQIVFQYASTGAPPLMRLNSNGLPTTSSMGVGFYGTFASGTMYWKISL